MTKLSSTSFDDNPVHVTISDDLIEDCFVSKFNEMKWFFDKDMCLRKGKTISCDHTFKLANHVGICRSFGY